MSVEKRWNELKNQFLQEKEVQKQGESLKINKKMFAMLNKGNFVLKLPKERVSELKKSRIGIDWLAGDKIMKEWIIIPLEYSSKWEELTEEAKQFAKSLSKK